MTDEEINMAIAKACGWWGNCKDNCMRPPNRTDIYCEIPNYTNDLNAMHVAERILEDPDIYAVQLAQVCGMKKYLFHATALQRAKAFLRTLGKWSE